LCAAESTLSSDHGYLQSFVAAFAAYPKNRLAKRYGPIFDELTRAGILGIGKWQNGSPVHWLRSTTI
jgi:hypothetical protein